MLKKWILVSAVTGLLAAATALPASAAGWASEEDMAAPAGSFTSEMAIPHRPGHFIRHHDYRFGAHVRRETRMMRHFG